MGISIFQKTMKNDKFYTFLNWFDSLIEFGLLFVKRARWFYGSLSQKNYSCVIKKQILSKLMLRF